MSALAVMGLNKHAESVCGYLVFVFVVECKYRLGDTGGGGHGGMWRRPYVWPIFQGRCDSGKSLIIPLQCTRSEHRAVKASTSDEYCFDDRQVEQAIQGIELPSSSRTQRLQVSRPFQCMPNLVWFVG